MDNLLTVQQAAALLQVSPATIRAWILRRQIQYVKISRSVRIRKSTLDRLIEIGSVPTRIR